MVGENDSKLEEIALTAMRVMVGLAFFSHGAQKLFGWFGGFGPDGGTAELMSRFGAAGVVETVCGAAIVLGLFTRAAAFLASGEMAVAYFWMHVGGSGALFWWANGGELVMIFSFTWLYFAARGGGELSIDAWIASRRVPASASGATAPATPGGGAPRASGTATPGGGAGGP